jgi:hypothetical protein
MTNVGTHWRMYLKKKTVYANYGDEPATALMLYQTVKR